jgi:DNA-binding CsgD family transcriptional regulator
MFTPLETSVAHELITGATNKEIAKRLGISHFTVRDYVQNIARKLSCRNRVEIVALLIARGDAGARPHP